MMRRVAAAGLVSLLAAACASAGNPEPTTTPSLPSPEPAVVHAERSPAVTSPSTLLVRGTKAIEDGAFVRADSLLVAVWQACGDSPAGRRALLLLGGARLDPRNRAADPDAAARAAARYLALSGSASWTRPLARQLYLLALELGGRPVGDRDAAGPVAPLSGDTTAKAAEDSVALEGSARADSGVARIDSGAARADSPAARDDDLVAVRPTPPRAAAQKTDVSAAPPAGRLLHLCAVPDNAADRGTPGLPLPRPSGESMAAKLAKLQEQITALEKELERIRKTIHP